MSALGKPASVSVEDYAGLDAVVPLPEIESELPLAEVYEGVEF